MATDFQITETITPFRSGTSDSDGTPRVSIAIVDPDHERAKTVAASLPGAKTGSVLLVPGYLPSLDDVAWLTNQGFEMILVGLDSNMQEALQTVQSLCALSQATVVVYSHRAEQELLIQSMRSGAREFLTFPFATDAIDEAITRVAVRIQASPAPKKISGKILAFVGAKGGAGVTTVASNYAVALAQDTTKNTLLIDFDLPSLASCCFASLVCPASSPPSTLCATPSGLILLFFPNWSSVTPRACRSLLPQASFRRSPSTMPPPTGCSP